MGNFSGNFDLTLITNQNEIKNSKDWEAPDCLFSERGSGSPRSQPSETYKTHFFKKIWHCKLGYIV